MPDIDPVDAPQFMLLVTSDRRLPDLMNSDDQIRRHLEESGVDLPMANVNLGGGRSCVFGIGRARNPRNVRAEAMLAQWGPVNIQIHGPAMFAGISARQAIDLVRLAQDTPPLAAVPS